MRFTSSPFTSSRFTSSRFSPLRAVSLVTCAALSTACDDDRITSGSGSTSSDSSSSTGGGSTPLALPQFVHDAARIDSALNPSAPIVISSSGSPETVEVDVDGTITEAALDGVRYVATVDASALSEGTHALVATAKIGGVVTGKAEGKLVVGKGSLQFTDFAKDGPAYSSRLLAGGLNDSIGYSWISIVGGKHQLSMNRLDGAFQRIDATDVVLNDPADEPLNGYTAEQGGSIGVVYRTPKPNDIHWSVKMRVVDATGAEKVPVQDLTGAGAAFSMEQAGADPGGFSAAWLHITPPTDPNNPPPVEIRFARWDMASNKLQGPLTLDMDQPEAAPGAGAQTLEPLAEIGIACSQTICLVTYSREKYNALVQLNVPKLYYAVIDLATATLVGTPKPVLGGDWDTQMFGHHLIALPDGTFQLLYTSNDTKAAVTPKSPCDEMLERDLLTAVKFDATGTFAGSQVVFDFEGTREFPRIAPHPAGFAMFWEDQRSECNAGGHIRMSANVASPAFDALLDPYVEMPGSVGLPPEDPTLAVVDTNILVGWSDNRHGNGLVDPKNELFFDTYWRK
jgi:hypothetical protein